MSAAPAGGGPGGPGAEKRRRLSSSCSSRWCRGVTVVVLVTSLVWFAYYLSVITWPTWSGVELARLITRLGEVSPSDLTYRPPYPGSNASTEYSGIPTDILQPIVTYYRGLATSRHQNVTTTATAASAAGDEQQVVFLTANSDDHFEESMGAVVGVQSCFPEAKVIYYDLGLSAEQSERLESVCSVEVRTFDASRYPVYVGLLEEKRWKPIIVHEVLTEHPVVFWMDASVRFACGGGRSSGFREFWRRSLEMCHDSGAAMFSRSSHTNFPVIHPRTYDYIPTKPEAMMETPEFESNSVLFCARHVGMMVRVMKWWVLCALHPVCMHPKPAGVGAGEHDQYERWHQCDFSGGNSRYAGCHRQDQSTLNTLLLNMYEFAWDGRFVNEQPTYGNGYIRIRRDEGVDWKQVRMCALTTPSR